MDFERLRDTNSFIVDKSLFIYEFITYGNGK